MSVPPEVMPQGNVLPFQQPPQPAAPAVPQGKRSRVRKESIPINTAEKQAEIYNRVMKFKDADIQSRDVDRDARLQRYAKFRLWVEEKTFPWPGATNIPITDIMEKSLRAQDTIHNAVMSNRPVVNAKALDKKQQKQEEHVDSLIDYQVFVEQPGEEFIGQAADAFINDGVLTIFVPWVREQREISDVRVFDPIPADADAQMYFEAVLNRAFPGLPRTPKNDGWDWVVMRKSDDGKREERIEIKFYTKPAVGSMESEVEMVVRENAVVFNGPRPTVLDYDDVLHPVRCENLQIPGPSNPNGAAHVIILSDPTIDEVKRLQRQGYYDLVSREDVDKLDLVTATRQDDGEKLQKDTLAGQTHNAPPQEARSQQTVTRLICFDCYDVDGDGVDEDVVWFIIEELKGKVCKAVYLSELYPSKPPRRPFGEGSMIPVRGRRVGISMLEILEGLHDFMKQLLDQAGDSGTLAITPFFFYRASAGTRPEIIRNSPGEGYPLNDPQRDVSFPQIGNPSAQAFAINMVTMAQQMQERAVVIGDAQFGRVPAGKSSAMRTTSNMAMLMGQGEARPERILRRFFIALCQVWNQIHQLNQHYLPADKKYRVAGYLKPNEDPYRSINTRDELQGQFQFDFRGAVLNTSKEQLRQGLQMMMQTYVNELAIQMGVIDPDGVYRLFRDVGKAFGGDPDQYLRPPSPQAGMTKILAEEAIRSIMNSQVPDGYAAELGGPREHMQKLMEFMQGDNFGLLQGEQVPLFKDYLQTVKQYLTEQVQQEQMMNAVGAFSQMMGGGQQQQQGGRPPESLPGGTSGNAMISGGGELIDETMMGAGGGAEQ